MVDWEKNDLRDEWRELSTDNKRLRAEVEQLRKELNETQRQFEAQAELADSIKAENERLENQVHELKLINGDLHIALYDIENSNGWK